MDEKHPFLGTDGLLYCSVCKEAVEEFYPKGSILEGKKHHRQCACDRKAYAENAKYHIEKEHQELVARNKGICYEEKRNDNVDISECG